MTLAPSLSGRDQPLESDEHDALVRRSRTGDLEAFNALVRIHHDAIHRLACRMLGDRDAAHDAVQETFIRAWKALVRFRGDARFTTWLRTIAVHQCLNEANRQARDAALIQPMNPESFDRCADDPAPFGGGRAAPRDDWATRLSVREALRSLPEKLRVVVTLYYYGELSVREIAEEIGAPRSTVFSRLDRGIERMGRLLERPEEES